MASAFLLTLLAGISCAAGAKPLSRFQYTQIHMGTPTRITVYAPDQETAEAACRAAFARFAALEQIMSDYRPTSELMRLCAKAGGPPVPVSADLFRVLAKAQEVAKRSGGAFDVTVGPYVQLWRQARRSLELPHFRDLRRAAELVGWRKMTLDPAKRMVQLLVPGMRLDLGGIAKGYACDCAVAELRKRGVTRAMVEAGGDIVVSGPPPGERGWRIEVENAEPDAPLRVALLAHAAISSSGDTEQYVEIGGRRYSHIVDPRTGLGLTERTAATIIAPNGLTSDPLATALCVLGREEGEALARSYPQTRAYIRRAPPGLFACFISPRPSLGFYLSPWKVSGVRWRLRPSPKRRGEPVGARLRFSVRQDARRRKAEARTIRLPA